MKLTLEQSIHQSRKVSAFRRLLSDVNISYKVYVWWAMAVVVAFGYYGIYPLLNVISDKKILIEEMRVANQNMEGKIEVLKEVRRDVREINEYKFYLDRYLPNQPDLQNYVVDLNVAASKAGFVIKKFSPGQGRTADDGSIDARVIFEGSGKIEDLVRNIENLKRITVVDSIVSLPEEGGNPRVNLKIKVFTAQ